MPQTHHPMFNFLYTLNIKMLRNSKGRFTKKSKSSNRPRNERGRYSKKSRKSTRKGTRKNRSNRK